ncbi:CHAT domain-containing protein [Microbacterium sp.]|uniref:CHAT domain-containing protein n=1 Tax=Microbacterium sp. TaxID=51671 RepID=UPI0028120DC1|nr:CHAT domain-containing protein [Microbacterium sp.]
MRLTADDLHARGVDLSNSGRLTAARRALRSAAERATSHEEKARIAGTLAYVLTRTGRPEEAERICREVLDAADGGSVLSQSAIAILHGQLGALAVERGDFDEALVMLGKAIAAETNPTRLGNMLINRSVALMRRHHLAQARADLDRAAECFSATGDTVNRAMTVHNAGYVALLEGDLVTALERMAEARPHVASSPVNMAVCDLDRAEVLREAGQVLEAEKTLEDVARSFGAAHMPQSRAEAEFHLARSLLTYDLARCAEVAGRAARRFRRLGSTAWAARADGIRLRALLYMPDAGRRRPTAEQVDQIVEALEQAGFPSEARMLRLTKWIACARRGEADPGVGRLRDSDPLPVRLLTHEARAVQAAARGKDAAVRRHAAAGLETLSEWQRSFGALDVASSIAMHGNGVMLEGLSAAIRSRRPDVLFEWSERARHFAHQVSPVRPPRDPEHAADLAQLRLLREEAGAMWEQDPRVWEIRERLRERQWATAGDGHGIPRVDLEKLRSNLESDTALLTYVYSRDALVCLVVPATGRPRVVDIDAAAVRERMPGLRADLDVVASVGGGPMAQVVGRALDVRLAALSRLLVETPLAAAGDPRRVLITAPGILAGMPWTMLPGMRGRSVSLARSASRWSASRSWERTGRNAGFAVGPGVARGAEEALTAAFAWEVNSADGGGMAPPPPVLQGADATVSAVSTLAEEVDVLHLVAHGRHALDAPMLSGLSLADGTLFGYDIDLIDRPPKTVVLSACELGRSSVRWGAEAMSMAHAWLHAGAVCVVAAPVTVADDVAAELLAALHGGLAAGLAPSDALAAASEETGRVSPFLVHGSGF